MSSTSKDEKQKALITFVGAKLSGHFVRDDFRLGSCDGNGKIG